MTLRWGEGFEIDASSNYLDNKYETAEGESVGTPGRLHGRWGAGTFVTPSLGSQATWTVGFGLYLGATPDPDDDYIALMTGGVEQIRLAINADRTLVVKRGSTTLETGTTVLPSSTWVYIEFQCTVHTSTGAYEVRINESAEMSDTGVNTAEAGSNNADIVKISIDSASLRCDDIYILDDQGTYDNDFLGDSVIEGLLPNGEGASLDWTPSTASTHYVLVDDPATSYNSTDFVSSDTIGHQDLYDFEDLSFITGSIRGVFVNMMASMDAIGSRELKAAYRNSGGSVDYGDDFTVNGVSTFEYISVLEQNPISAAPWAVADIDDGQFGVEVVS